MDAPMLLDVEPTAILPLAAVRQRAERKADEALAVLQSSRDATPAFYTAYAALDQVIDLVEFRGSLPDWAKWAQAARSLHWHARMEEKAGAHTEHVDLLARCARYAEAASAALLDLSKVEGQEYYAQRIGAGPVTTLNPQGRAR